MKKIFALIFSLGLLTAAFAQQGRRQSYDDSYNNYGYQSSPYQGNNGYGYQDPYNRNYQWNDRENGYDNDRYRQERMREMYYRRQRRMYDDYSYRTERRKPSFQLIITNRNRY